MHAYDLYGTSLDLNSAKIFLEKNLSLQFTQRDSSYCGVYFLTDNCDGENFQIKKNLDLIDGEPVMAEFLNYSVLVFVNHTNRSDEIYKLLQGTDMKRLKHNLYS